MRPANTLLHEEFGKMYDTNTDCRERKHASHKRHFGPNTQYDLLTAKSFVSDAQVIANEVRDAERMRREAKNTWVSSDEGDTS